LEKGPLDQSSGFRRRISFRDREDVRFPPQVKTSRFPGRLKIVEGAAEVLRRLTVGINLDLHANAVIGGDEQDAPGVGLWAERPFDQLDPLALKRALHVFGAVWLDTALVSSATAHQHAEHRETGQATRNCRDMAYLSVGAGNA